MKKLFISLSFIVTLVTTNLYAANTAQEHFDKNYPGVTVQIARDFIMQNYANNLSTVYNVCLQYGVNNDMIAEILAGDFPGLTGTVVKSFFDSNNFDGNALGFNTDNTTGNTLNASDEKYYKYLWHIDSSNSNSKKISQEISNAAGYTNPLDEPSTEADINILDAWNVTKGEDVVVAVIDDGGDINHEDLKANIYLTYNADDETTDVSNLSNDISTASHGNSCAGFVAAPINGEGIIGTAPKAKLILIKLEGSGDIETIRAFEYAKNNGAKVISCSWGTNQVSEALVTELKSLYDDGITVLFASGNEGVSLDTEANDESEVEWVIGVGSSGENNDVTTYSNYGVNIDVLAPGGDSQDSIGILGLDDTGTQGSTKNYGLVSNSYAFMDGTSFATPVAAGVVALMYSANPSITPKHVRDVLTSTADKIGGSSANYQNGFDEKRAYGKINATKAVQEAKNLIVTQ